MFFDKIMSKCGVNAGRKVETFRLFFNLVLKGVLGLVHRDLLMSVCE